MEEVTSNKRKMKDLEDNLLYRSTSTQGSLVDDDSLISVLGVTKTTSEEVSEKLIVQGLNSRSILRERNIGPV